MQNPEVSWSAFCNCSVPYSFLLSILQMDWSADQMNQIKWLTYTLQQMPYLYRELS